MTLPLPLVVATGNPDKAREITEIFVAHADGPLAAYAVVLGTDTYAYVLDRVDAIADAAAHAVLRAAPTVAESGTTLEENARIKAGALCDALHMLAVADDTGLEVDALDGAPGVSSARYAGEGATYADNVAKLLRELEGVYPALRRARFVTVALARWPDGREVVARGEVEGVVAAAPRGSGGFGYDPVFVPIEGGGRTFAEMTPAEKHSVSHRGRAFRALADLLSEKE